MKLLIAGSLNLDDDKIRYLSSLGFEITSIPREDVKIDFDVSDFDAVICNWLFTHHDIQSFKNLKFIQLLSAGLDRVPLDYIKGNNIVLKNARGVYSRPMAEFAVCGVLQLYKQSKFYYQNSQNQIWQKNRSMLELSNKKVCIIGAGSVGQETARLFGAFTDEIYGVDLYPNESAFFKKVFSLEKIDELLAISDIVILTLPLTEQTRGMFNRDRFEKMKNDAVIVNIARGGIIDENALADALQAKLYGAVLDVFCEEPLTQENALWGKNNIILTPHVSFLSDKNDTRIWELISENLKVFVDERK